MSKTDPSLDPVAAKKRKHAKQAAESRSRKKNGRIKIWVEVERGRAVDFLFDRGHLKEWSLDEAGASEIGGAFSEFIEVSGLFDDGGA
ncbi:hypothetical protein V5279_23910 [Bradyrhizobium sp. 26S5]|uniref:hypothetical protein n=1 Tax=Bradyrhizobium sp. 26S5 TaxID=3139729 RepID=UPI0030D30714